MDKLLLILKTRFGQHHFEDNDLIDRLNSRYTIIGLILAIGLIMGNVFIGDPINCWTPAQFSDMHDNYAHSFCWLKGTYYLPTDEITIPDRSKPRLYYVSYYQWTPFILFAMSIFFLIPQLLWRISMNRSSLKLRQLVHRLKDSSNLPEDTESVRRSLGNYFHVRSESRLSLTFVYFMVKVLYIVNALVQFIVLNAFLSFQFTSHGFEALKKFFTGADWFESPRFPRVTMCDFMIRNLGSNQHWYALQCNLPINMYNEKIFFILWIWLLILTILNIVSILFWIVSLSKSFRLRELRRLLAATAQTKQFVESEELLNDLKIDGFLILQLIGQNTNDIVIGNLFSSLIRHKNEFVETKSSENA